MFVGRTVDLVRSHTKSSHKVLGNEDPPPNKTLKFAPLTKAVELESNSAYFGA